MARLIFAVLLTVAIVSFAVSNSHHVEISLVFGSAVKIRLIFLLCVTLVIGMAAPFFYRTVRRVQEQRRFRGAGKVPSSAGAAPSPKQLGPAV